MDETKGYFGSPVGRHGSAGVVATSHVGACYLVTGKLAGRCECKQLPRRFDVCFITTYSANVFISPSEKKSTSSECNFFANKMILKKIWHFHRQNLFSWGNHGNLIGLRCTLHQNQHFDGMIFQTSPSPCFLSQPRLCIFGIHTGGEMKRVAKC